jgi:hypothetical protein
VTTECGCEACESLLEECGPDLFAFYSRRLLQRGWAGVMTEAERGYVRKHRPLSEAQLAGLAKARQASPLASFTVQGTEEQE